MKKLICATIVVLAAAASAHAQGKCEVLKGLLQGRLEEPVGWLGEAYGTVNETDVLVGTMRPLVGPTLASNAGLMVENAWTVVWNFGSQGTIVTEIPIGLVLEPAPGPMGAGMYRGMGRIVSGTVRFAKATGTLLLEGPYAIWLAKPGDEASIQGRWNAEITMRVCKAN